MSSFIAYEADNLTIITMKGEWILMDQFIPTIRIYLSILLNGKIKNLFHEFEIVRNHNSALSQDDGSKEEIGPEYFTLKDWVGWNILFDTLKQMGYLQDEPQAGRIMLKALSTM